MNEFNGQEHGTRRYGWTLAAILLVIALFVVVALAVNVAHSAPQTAPHTTSRAHACTHVQALTRGLATFPRPATYVDVCVSSLPTAPDFLIGTQNCDYVRLDISEPAVQLQCLFIPNGTRGQFQTVNGARVWTFTQCLYYGDTYGTGIACATWTPQGPLSND